MKRKYMTEFLDALATDPYINKAARRTGINPATIFRWLEQSKRDESDNAADSPFVVEWSGVSAYFHQHCDSAYRMSLVIAESRLRSLASEGFEETLVFQGRITYREREDIPADVTDPDELELLYGQRDRYERDALGHRIPLTVKRAPSAQLLLKLMESHFPIYRNRVEVQSTNMVSVGVFRGGKLEPSAPKAIAHKPLITDLPSLAPEIEPGEERYGLVVGEPCKTSEEFEAYFGRERPVSPEVVFIDDPEPEQPIAPRVNPDDGEGIGRGTPAPGGFKVV